MRYSKSKFYNHPSSKLFILLLSIARPLHFLLAGVWVCLWSSWSTGAQFFFTKLCICRSNVLLLLPVKIHAFSEGPFNKAFTAAFFKSVLQDPALIRTSWLGALCLWRSGHLTSKCVWMSIYCMRWMSIYHIRWECVRWMGSKMSATSQQIRHF